MNQLIFADYNYKYYRNILIVCFLLTCQNNIYSSHFAGGDITYKCIGSDTFEIAFTVYRECVGTTPSTSYTLSVNNTCGYSSPSGVTVMLVDPLTGDTCSGSPETCSTEVSQVCSFAISECNSGGYPGFEEYIYKGLAILPDTCSSWILSYNTCCRALNCGVTNLQNPSGKEFYVESTLNNSTSTGNNSPVFFAPPIPVFCLNDTANYNFGVYEKDGDSVSFHLVSALSNGYSIPYNAPWSGNQPITGITIDSATGHLSFFPDYEGAYVVVILVKEYRDGILIGSVRRDVPFIVRSYACNNAPPDFPAPIVNLSGNAIQTGSYSLVLCEGSSYTMDIEFSDSDLQDTLSMVTNLEAVFPGATYNTAGTNPLISTISWTAPVGSGGTSNYFSVIIGDNACGIPGRQSYQYNITVNHPQIDASILSYPSDTAINQGETAELCVNPLGLYSSYDFSWNNGSTSPCITVSPDYTENYVVSISNGCDIASDTITVTVLSPLLSNNPPVANYNFEIFPNPYRYETNVHFTLSSKEMVELTVFNVMGELVEVIEKSRLSTGIHTYTFNAYQSGYAAGVYFIRLQTMNGAFIKKVVEMKH